jgi:hypothetical protein
MSLKPRAVDRKPDPRSTTAKMSPEQREQLEKWLFDEQLSYLKTIERCKDAFGIEVPMTGIRNFYRHNQQQRTVRRLAESTKFAKMFEKKFAKNPKKIYHALLNIVGQAAFDEMLNAPEGGTPDMGRVHHAMDLLEAAQKDLREDDKLVFDREKWEFDATEACLKQLPELKVISDTPGISYKEKIQQVRLRLFGTAPD